MDLQLKGMRALVTGASKGIGKAVAQRLAAEGCDLVVAARGESDLIALADAIRAENNVRVEPIRSDLSDSEDQRRLARQVGAVDILVNNAGANPAGELDEIPEATWRKAWDLKVFGTINLTRDIYAAMKARGRGVIVNVIGNSGERMDARYILGSSGNVALMGFTRALGGRSPDFGVRVVGVNPGLTATDRASFMLRGWSNSKYGTPDRWAEVMAELDLPFGRMAEPGEVADMVVFLASPRSAYVSGTIVTVDGGASNRRA